MKNRIILMLLCLAVFIPNISAQDIDPFLDDTYYSKKDDELIRKQAQEKAEREYQARRKAYEERRLKDSIEYEKYKAKIHSSEIDAYNGRLSMRDEDSQLHGENGPIDRDDRGAVYGEYSSRLRKYHSDGSVIINNPENVYIYEDGYSFDDYRYYDRYPSRASFASYYYPWYDGFYEPWYYPRNSWGFSWSYYPYHRVGYWGYRYPYYDPWYYDYAVGYFPYYGGYWGGSYYRGYYGGYVDGYNSGSYKRYNDTYRNGNRSYQSHTNYRSYSPYQAVNTVRKESYDNGGYYQSRSDGSYSRRERINTTDSYSRSTRNSDTYRESYNSSNSSYQRSSRSDYNSNRSNSNSSYSRSSSPSSPSTPSSPSAPTRNRR